MLFILYINYCFEHISYSYFLSFWINLKLVEKLLIFRFCSYNETLCNIKYIL